MKDSVRARMTYDIVIEYANIDIYKYDHAYIIHHDTNIAPPDTCYQSFNISHPQDPCDSYIYPDMNG